MFPKLSHPTFHQDHWKFYEVDDKVLSYASYGFNVSKWIKLKIPEFL